MNAEDLKRNAQRRQLRNAREARARLKGITPDVAEAITDLLRAFDNRPDQFTANFERLTLKARQQLEKYRI